MSKQIQEKELKKAKEAFIKFGLGTIAELKKLRGGIINLSYKVESSRGSFVLQNLNPTWDERVIQDYQNVQSFLRTRGISVPVLLPTKSGAYSYQNENGIWRIFEYIENDGKTKPTPEIAFEAGTLLGKFHQIMSKTTFKPKFKLEGFHQTQKIIGELERVFADKRYSQMHTQLEDEYETIIRDTPTYYLESKNKVVIHGDPKLDNFLFKNQKAIAILDLDTIMLSDELIDLGDAMRSWCRTDSREFSKDMFNAGMEGYSSQSEKKFSDEQVLDATKLITLELSARFLIDFFKQEYFSWDEQNFKSRAEHNLARCRNCLSYYRSMK
jgi:Ser/Thr protein kinase RdoA (MazF antagonist)